MSPLAVDPLSLIQPRRKVEGISAILLPFDSGGAIDWPAFRAHAERTWAAGLTPAVNMDTGYVNLLAPAERLRVLEEARSVAAGRLFVAGAFVGDQSGAPFDRDAYGQAMDAITRHGGTPVVFQSFGLTQQGDDALIESYESLGKLCDRWIGFELGTMFAPFGRIYSLDVYRRLMEIPSCAGAKHSSLSRELEWQRLVLRNQVRPEFRVYTGNDLAIDMIMYGSDYLLGLSTFAPDLFARRDAFWAAGDLAFYELNDTLQYLGNLTFRVPTPAYKHSAAMFLHLRGWVASDRTHAGSAIRPASDRAILAEIGARLGIEIADA
ncbi:MAG: dihydrodipicolinate synthase family protein [Planctomycetia bacterium]|nr:dihydrodipicolinate synthase family protein [Planctomycetia bacterium]